ncbi:M43 family zinc metalloprotease [Flagellimonas aquimarina]|uniref:M43 family zinc metalloprotease n=1 Tax=Flagellimonas aquimarina TaxID=2201895 RepID=UPI0014026FB3|nr:M43 family zinc metalloprotease [Allomuricauda koreensis]
MKKKAFKKIALLILLSISSCSKSDEGVSPIGPEPGQEVSFLPVVVHIIHSGETIGEGPNLSDERIRRQIEILNEDFRRKQGTRGFNDHPVSEDSKIEFVLAKQTTDGTPTNGINRINADQVTIPDLGYNQNHYSQYDYWPPDQFINIWVTPLPESAMCLALGEATGPDTDLPGSEFLALPGPNDSEGILINWMHFGESDIDCHAKYGRTLTHEMGHYLGLLHTWGNKDCESNDYCDDTPAVDEPVYGRIAFLGCNDEAVMIENYMNYSEDDVMNVFTKNQIARMHYVLKNHKGRKALLNSIGLNNP